MGWWAPGNHLRAIEAIEVMIEKDCTNLNLNIVKTKAHWPCFKNRMAKLDFIKKNNFQQMKPNHQYLNVPNHHFRHFRKEEFLKFPIGSRKSNSKCINPKVFSRINIQKTRSNKFWERPLKIQMIVHWVQLERIKDTISSLATVLDFKTKVLKGHRHRLGWWMILLLGIMKMALDPWSKARIASKYCLNFKYKVWDRELTRLMTYIEIT